MDFENVSSADAMQYEIFLLLQGGGGLCMKSLPLRYLLHLLTFRLQFLISTSDRRSTITPAKLWMAWEMLPSSNGLRDYLAGQKKDYHQEAVGSVVAAPFTFYLFSR